MYQRIVVPLDGSSTAEQALPEAIGLARLSPAPVHLLRVISFLRLEVIGPYALAVEAAATEKTVEQEEKAADDYLNQISKTLKDEGINVDVEVRHGFADREIVAATKPGDILVMASHGRGGVSRWLLGSVAEDVLRHASVPVLLVKDDPSIRSTHESESAVAPSKN